jgi:hypothetical protein
MSWAPYFLPGEQFLSISITNQLDTVVKLLVSCKQTVTLSQYRPSLLHILTWSRFPLFLHFYLKDQRTSFRQLHSEWGFLLILSIGQCQCWRWRTFVFCDISEFLRQPNNYRLLEKTAAWRTGVGLRSPQRIRQAAGSHACRPSASSLQFFVSLVSYVSPGSVVLAWFMYQEQRL